MLYDSSPCVFLDRIRKHFSFCLADLEKLCQKTEVPIVSADRAVMELADSGGFELSSAVYYAPALAACCNWKTNGSKIYDFDPELAGSLLSQVQRLSDGGSLPVDALRQLPDGCFYVRASGLLADDIDGCFVWRETDPASQGSVLQVVFLTSDLKEFLPGALYTDRGEAVQNCLPDAGILMGRLVAAADLNMSFAQACLFHPTIAPAARLHTMLLGVLQMLLYLISEEAEIAAGKGEEAPAPAVGDVTMYTVGHSIGERLRSVSETSRRAYFRQGHWHRYWTGPKKDPSKRRLILKWVAPVLVNGSNMETAEVLSVSVK